MPGRRLANSVALAVALAAPAGAGTGCGSDAPRQVEVVPGKRAGLVLEAAGMVTAMRAGQAARPLRAGDEISGDDEIQTGADGTVLVELDHNHVTFSLPANRTQRVGSSPAWTQPLAAARPGTTDEHSAAAGRPVERSAVDTAVSGGAPPVGAAAPAAPEPPAAPPADPIRTRDKDKGAKPKGDEPADRAPPPPPKNMAPALPADVAAPRLDLRSGGGGGGGGGSGSGTLERNLAVDPGSTGAAAAAAPSADLLAATGGITLLSIKVTGGLTGEEVLAAFGQRVDACSPKRSAKVNLSVAADGTITSVTPPDRRTLTIEEDTANSDAAVCVKKALEGVKLPAKRKKSAITLSL